MKVSEVKALEKIGWAPYEEIQNPTREDWKKSYDAFVKLAQEKPRSGQYPNVLGLLFFYGRHTGAPDYAEARQWFEKGAERGMVESSYKLADMEMNGLGGPKDEEHALCTYILLYYVLKAEFESGMYNGKFADVALRMGRLHKEGKSVYQSDMEALGLLLEAQYALELRKAYDFYGDDVVGKNIRDLINSCEQPDEETRNSHYFGMGLGRVSEAFITPEHDLAFMIQTTEEGLVRLEFRRKRKDGSKPDKVLWSIAPAMQCMLTDFVVVYAADVQMIWNKNPGKAVVCDRYEYDPQKNMHCFYLNDEPQCRLMGGDYALAMDEFFYTGVRDSMGPGGDVVM